MLCFGAFCVAALGELLHGEGADALRYDDALRRTGAVVSGEIVHVERVHFTGYKGRGRTEYTPVTRQTFEGVDYETALDVYTVTNEPDYYRVGQRLTIMVDPDDATTAGVRSAELREMFIGRVARGRGAAFTALPLLAVGAPLLTVQTVESVTRRIRTRRTRRWARARRQVLSGRRRARRVAGWAVRRTGTAPPGRVVRDQPPTVSTGDRSPTRGT
ncbi:DUF3592 domain-containing protein [Curtobacterium sp. RHCJP20]|uniref:DUF3592 domain-containing protein n=1 Tax=Curtobacterium subtropicum TaxID=3055138 RepID=A0ABT7TLQ2_9MICO|nr:DUF3592 domain-containing protein [Curtobacterium subtropicum]MDM7889847.1 DUF3592 domain-containing protein [Curtobacterium subtropicum]